MTETENGLKLAAVDLDGTLLGPDGQISEANLQAVRRLQEAGVQVVLASGRHYQNMQRYADRLPGVQWLVSCQGGEVSDTSRSLVLNREFLPEANAGETLELGGSLGLASVIYTVEGICTGSEWNEGFEFYAALSGTAPRRVDVKDLLKEPIFKVIWVGDKAEIDRAVVQSGGITESVQSVRTHQRLLEFMPVGVSKASALKTLAAHLNLAASEIAAFGDGENDVPMFAWAGVSVAMPHGWPAAIASASYTAPEGPADAAFARGVEIVLNARREKAFPIS
jgi:Cof subfamily protein (haloacid dehalogenase superfamily)